MKSCAGIDKKRSVLTESKERSSTNGSSYEGSSCPASSSPPPSSILGWPIRKASFRKSSKENIKFDHNKPALVADSGFKGKEVNIAG